MIPFEVVRNTSQDPEAKNPETKISTTVSSTDNTPILNCNDKMVIAPGLGALAAFIVSYLLPVTNFGVWLSWIVLLISICATIIVSFPVWRSWLSEEGILSGRAMLLLTLVLGAASNIIVSFSSFTANLTAPFSSVIVWTFFIHAALHLSDQIREIANRDTVLAPAKSLEKRGDKVDVGPGQILPYDAVVVDGIFEVSEHKFGLVRNFLLKKTGDEISSGSLVTVGSGKVSVQCIDDEREIIPFLEAFEGTIKQSPNEIHTRRLRRSLFVTFLLFSGALLGVWLSEAPISYTLERVAMIFGLAMILEMESLFWVIQKAYLSILFRSGVFFKAPKEAIRFLAKVKSILLDPSADILAPKTKSIRVIDDRIDEKSLFSSIYCVLSNAKTFKLKDVGLLARSKLDKPLIFKVEGFQEKDNGAVAIVEGTTFSIGDEEFLIDNGVHLDLTDGNHHQMMISFGGAIVAICDFSQPFEENGKVFVEDMNQLSITSHLVGANSQSSLDELGKRSGVELARIHGGLNPQGFKSIISSHKEALFIGHKETPREAFTVSQFSGTLFDPLAFRFDRDDMTLFGSELESVVSAIKGARGFFYKTTIFGWLLGAIAVFAITTAVLGISQFGVVLMLWSFLMMGLRYRPFPRISPL